MTTQRQKKLRKLPFWKRWLLRGLLILTSLLTLVFVAMTAAMPFLYDTDGQGRGVMLYAMGMSIVLGLICADSARRIYRRLNPKS